MAKKDNEEITINGGPQKYRVIVEEEYNKPNYKGEVEPDFRTIYEQTVHGLDIKKVISAVNGKETELPF